MQTVKIWHEDHSSRGCGNYVAYKTLVGHTSYVTALAYLSPGQSPSLPRGAVVTGARDPAVGVWDTGALLRSPAAPYPGCPVEFSRP